MTTIGLNNTEAERTRRLAIELAKKLRLEPLLAQDLMRIYQRISVAGRILYAQNGQIINVSQFQDEIRAALVRHYRRVFKEFNSPFDVDFRTIIESQKQSLHSRDIKDQQEQFIQQKSQVSSQQITDSTQRRWNDSIKGALAALLLLGAGGDNRAPEISIAPPGVLTQDEQGTIIQAPDAASIRTQVANEAGKNFDRTSPGRADTAGATETQSAAETNKFIIASVVLIAANLFTQGKKVWMTILDGKERQSHGIANGQRRSVTEPYIVQGEPLMYPGDISLGATVSNVVNCRCGSMIVLP